MVIQKDIINMIVTTVSQEKTTTTSTSNKTTSSKGSGAIGNRILPSNKLRGKNSFFLNNNIII